LLRVLLWRLLGVLAAVAAFELCAWLFTGGPGRALRGTRLDLPAELGDPAGLPLRLAGEVMRIAPAASAALGAVTALCACLVVLRLRARHRRRYMRLRVEPYRTDRASAEAVVAMYESLHKRLLQRWWRRLLWGQPSVSLELHHSPAGGRGSWFAVCCPQDLREQVQAALRGAYPNCRIAPSQETIEAVPVVLRLKKREEFVKRVKQLDRFEHEREPSVNRLITAMGACGEEAFVQLSATPTPAFFEQLALRAYRRREERVSRRAGERPRRRSMIDEEELRGALAVQHRPLFFVDLRVIAASRGACEQVAAQLRAGEAENRLVERGTSLRHGALGLYARRVRRGEGNALAAVRKGVFASTELAAIWQLPSSDYATVPLARAALPVAPAPPAIHRPAEGDGTLRDAYGPVSIHVQMRRQNTAVPGTVEQGKSSYLVATVAEDLRRERCAVMVLDPKGDAADAALSLVPPERTCTLLDFACPTCGFNPLAVDAPADVIADYVVAALKNLFTDADIRASSDRYLRNAIIAVLAHDRRATLWDAARLLSVGEEGYAYRRAVGTRVRGLPEFKEISAFFTEELAAQLADARSTTTAKLDAPVNKLARLLNSSSIKRVLLNESLRLDFERIVAGREVLIVKGALGAMGAGNTAVLMQLLVGMLDAALARQQDLVEPRERIAVALKVDEAPLVLNRGFAETLALKRSAGLETVACWQSDAQWLDREVRDQLDALFAHRVYFATASSRDARAGVTLTMAEFSDSIRPGVRQLSVLGHPDVRLHLPKHHAIVSWTTPQGRQPPFIAQTLPLGVDRGRIALHAARQRERGGTALHDLRQPRWDADRSDRLEAPGHASDRLEAPEHSSDRLEAPAHPGTNAAGASPGLPPRRAQAVWATDPIPPPPPRAADSFRELVDLDRSGRARPVPGARSGARVLEPDGSDLEILRLVARFGHVLTSQIHRHFNAMRAATTTQRRLKRLADAGFLRRLQFHRRDGGGVPMCCVITPRGLELLGRRGLLGEATAGAAVDARGGGAAALRRVRHEVHVVGWTLAVARLAGGRHVVLRGAAEAVLSPPSRTGPAGRAVIGPDDLRLPGGCAPHEFLRSDPSGARGEVAQFETLRPDAVIELAGFDLLVELDDRLPQGAQAAKLERYEHFLTGWSLHTSRYGKRAEAAPLVVFVCRDRARARACAGRADSLLRACRAYAGEYPFEWQYSGRESVLFVSERDAHEGHACAYGVPRLPPHVRVAAAHGDTHAAETTVEVRELPLARPAAARASSPHHTAGRRWSGGPQP
jgi:Replication-relaxation